MLCVREYSRVTESLVKAREEKYSCLAAGESLADNAGEESIDEGDNLTTFYIVGLSIQYNFKKRYVKWSMRQLNIQV